MGLSGKYRKNPRQGEIATPLPSSAPPKRVRNDDLAEMTKFRISTTLLKNPRPEGSKL